MQTCMPFGLTCDQVLAFGTILLAIGACLLALFPVRVAGSVYKFETPRDALATAGMILTVLGGAATLEAILIPVGDLGTVLGVVFIMVLLVGFGMLGLYLRVQGRAKQRVNQG
ncbi:hypothetical protein [Kocuria rosea]|uniref:hypothetical protein n=1 Tax=Kocuria rosea TaxID=1275 RepID=UPI00301923DE